MATIKGDNLYEYFGDIKKYVELGPQANIIVTQADYHNSDTFVFLDKLIDLMSSRVDIAESPLLIWYKGV